MALEMKIKTNYQKKIRSKNRTISSKTSEERCYGAIPPPPLLLCLPVLDGGLNAPRSGYQVNLPQEPAQRTTGKIPA